MYILTSTIHFYTKYHNIKIYNGNKKRKMQNYNTYFLDSCYNKNIELTYNSNIKTKKLVSLFINNKYIDIHNIKEYCNKLNITELFVNDYNKKQIMNHYWWIFKQNKNKNILLIR